MDSAIPLFEQLGPNKHVLPLNKFKNSVKHHTQLVYNVLPVEFNILFDITSLLLIGVFLFSYSLWVKQRKKYKLQCYSQMRKFIEALQPSKKLDTERCDNIWYLPWLLLVNEYISW